MLINITTQVLNLGLEFRRGFFKFRLEACMFFHMEGTPEANQYNIVLDSPSDIRNNVLLKTECVVSA